MQLYEALDKKDGGQVAEGTEVTESQETDSKEKLRIGSRDLKVAATALVNHALLLSANRTDFERVPG